MDCEGFKKLLEEYINLTLDNDVCLQMTHHYIHCEECYKLYFLESIDEEESK